MFCAEHMVRKRGSPGALVWGSKWCKSQEPVALGQTCEVTCVGLVDGLFSRNGPKKN